MSTPFDALKEHAEEKLAEEERYHLGMAKAGRKISRNRIDRRPLWVATIHLAQLFGRKTPPPEIRTRQDAWVWLCATAIRLTANDGNQFEAVIELSELFRLPGEQLREVLAERAQVMAVRAEKARLARAADLRAELAKLEARAPVPAALPENVIAFAPRRAVNA